MVETEKSRLYVPNGNPPGFVPPEAFSPQARAMVAHPLTPVVLFPFGERY